MASEAQKEEFLAATREEPSQKLGTFDTSTPKLEENETAQAQENVLNKLRKTFADFFLCENTVQRNHDIYYCVQKGECKDQQSQLLSCFMKADESGEDVGECCSEEILEMKNCLNTCIYKLMEKKMDFLRLISDVPYYYTS